MPSKDKRARAAIARARSARADWAAIRKLVIETRAKDNAIADAHDIHVNTLRRRIAREGWRRPLGSGTGPDQLKTLAVVTALKLQESCRAVTTRAHILTMRLLQAAEAPPKGASIEDVLRFAQKVLETLGLIADVQTRLITNAERSQKLTERAQGGAAPGVNPKGFDTDGPGSAEGRLAPLAAQFIERYDAFRAQCDAASRDGRDRNLSEDPAAG